MVLMQSPLRCGTIVHEFYMKNAFESLVMSQMNTLLTCSAMTWNADLITYEQINCTCDETMLL